MTKDAQRIAIAHDQEWWDFRHFDGELLGRPSNDGLLRPLPDYLNDLNAMHEVERAFDPNSGLAYDYAETLAAIAIGDEFHDEDFKPNGFGWFAAIHATAAQRAEAYLKTKGIWRDEQ